MTEGEEEIAKEDERRSSRRRRKEGQGIRRAERRRYETSAMAAATTTTVTRLEYKDIDKSNGTGKCHEQKRGEFRVVQLVRPVSDEEMDDANEEEDGKQEEEIWVGHFGVEFSKNGHDAKQFSRQNWRQRRCRRLHNICIKKNIATARRKRRRKRTKGSQ